jgi:hypothetical protein
MVFPMIYPCSSASVREIRVPGFMPNSRKRQIGEGIVKCFFFMVYPCSSVSVRVIRVPGFYAKFQGMTN